MQKVSATDLRQHQEVVVDKRDKAQEIKKGVLETFVAGTALPLDPEVVAIKEHCERALACVISRIKRCELGVWNKVYMIDADERYVVKSYRSHTLASVLDNGLYIKQLRDSGVPIPEVVSCVEFNGRPVRITRYAVGENATYRDVEEAGCLLATFHLKAKDILKIERPKPMPVVKSSSKKPVDPILEKFDECKDWESINELREIYAGIESFESCDLPSGWIYGDYSFTNLIKNGDEPLVCIDLDNMCHNSYLRDVTRCQFSTANDEDGNFSMDQVKLFLGAYHRVRPLCMEELKRFFPYVRSSMVYIALNMYRDMYVNKCTDVSRIYDHNPDLVPDKMLERLKQMEGLPPEGVDLFEFFGLTLQE